MKSRIMANKNFVLLLLALVCLNLVDAQTAYITNSALNRVLVLDIATEQITATIPVGACPLGVAVSSDGTRVYVSNNIGGTISVISTASNSVIATIPVGSSPLGLCLSPDGTKLLVSDGGDNVVHNPLKIINTQTNTVINTISTGVVNTTGACFLPDGSRAYVSSWNSDTVCVIDIASASIVAKIKVLQRTYDAISTLSGDKIYITNGERDKVYVINTTSNTLVDSIAVGDYPRCMALSIDGSKIYVGNNSWGGTINVISTITDNVTATIPAGNNIYGISLTPDGSKLYATNQVDSTIAVINTSTNTFSHFINLDSRPFSFGKFISSYTPTAIGIENNIENEEKWNVYPNPSTGNISVVLDETEAVEISVTDITGKQLQKKKLMGQSKFNIEIKEIGIYYITINSAKRNVVKKVVIIGQF